MKTFNKLLLFAMMSSVFEGKNPFPETKYKEINGKCKLPGCEGEMNYGGYCCPDHCRQHKEILKEENRQIQKQLRKKRKK